MLQLLLMAALLVASPPSSAQDDEESPGPAVEEDFDRRRRQGPPEVKPGQKIELDADFDKIPTGKSSLDLWVDAGDAIWDREYPVDDVGDVAEYLERLDRQLRQTGSDKPRWDIGQNAVRAQGNAIRAYAQGREALGLISEGAGPIVDAIFPELRPIVYKQLELAQAILGLANQQKRGEPVDPESFRPFEARADKLIESMKPLRQMTEDAYRFVEAAQGHIRSSESGRMQLVAAGDGTVDMAKRLDDRAIEAVTRNLASGREVRRDSVQGRSGPVLEALARRLDAAARRTQLTYEWSKRMTDPRMGYIALVMNVTKSSAEIVKQASQEGARGDPNVGRHAQEAQDLAMAVVLIEGKVEHGWGQIRERLIGTLPGGGDFEQRLPGPQPPTRLHAQAPRHQDRITDAPNQRIRSKPIRYPDSLKDGTRAIMQREGLSDGNFQCGPRGC